MIMSANYKSVRELTREQLQELKVSYLDQLRESGEYDEVVGVSYDEIADIDGIVPDDAVFDHYEGTCFVDDDFFCTANREGDDE